MERLVHEQIQYLEFVTEDIERIKKFYMMAFGWEFTDYGENYTAFSGEYVDGGFAPGTPVPGTVLPILYSSELEFTQKKVVTAGGKINKEIFAFPGGRRFHFFDPDGNEIAVWSDK